MPKEELNAAALSRVLEDCQAHCPPGALEHLSVYLAMLMRWNRSMNLVGARTWQDAAKDLLADSLHLARFLESLPLPQNPLSWDPGAGAGLPGIPLRCVWQKGAYHMVEIRAKRALFLSQVIGTISLPNTFVHNEDMRTFMGSTRADLVVSRAFMPWEKVLALVADNVAAGGHVVFMSTALPQREDIGRISQGFSFQEHAAYPSPSGTRFLWACCRKQPPA